MRGLFDERADGDVLRRSCSRPGSTTPTSMPRAESASTLSVPLPYRRMPPEIDPSSPVTPTAAQEPVVARPLDRQSAPLRRITPRRPEPARPLDARHRSAVSQEPQGSRQDGEGVDSCVQADGYAWSRQRLTCSRPRFPPPLRREIRHTGQEGAPRRLNIRCCRSGR